MTEELSELFTAAIARGPVLLALDFDGTLAELQDDPEKSHLLPVAQEALVRISAAFADSAHQLALVSGRDLETLARLAAVPVGTVLIGSHGAQRGVVSEAGAQLTDAGRTAAEEELWQSLRSRFSEIAAHSEGAWVEEKTLAVVLHTRLVSETSPGRSPESLVAQGAEAAFDLGVSPLLGKNVLEAPLRRADKGTALRAMREELGSQTVLYAGDDVTDEDAFAALEPCDFSIKVGPGESVARFRLADPAAVGQFLGRVAAAL